MRNLITIPTIVKGLLELGVRQKSKLLVHCSLSSLGHVQGGSQTVIEGLMSVVGTGGCIAMPAFSAGRFDPSEWGSPPVPPNQWNRIRFETPRYHPRKTPVDPTMSVVYELFRTWPGSRRSNHPHSSFSAWGEGSTTLLAPHALDDRFGESSPLRRMYDRDFQVLFLGTGFSTNTCFHLAEYRQPNAPKREFFRLKAKGSRAKLARYEDVDTDSSRFEGMGADFERECTVARTKIGTARCRYFPMRRAVDFAGVWLSRN